MSHLCLPLNCCQQPVIRGEVFRYLFVYFFQKLRQLFLFVGIFIPLFYAIFCIFIRIEINLYILFLFFFLWICSFFHTGNFGDLGRFKPVFWHLIESGYTIGWARKNWRLLPKAARHYYFVCYLVRLIKKCHICMSISNQVISGIKTSSTRMPTLITECCDQYNCMHVHTKLFKFNQTTQVLESKYSKDYCEVTKTFYFLFLFIFWHFFGSKKCFNIYMLSHFMIENVSQIIIIYKGIQISMLWSFLN